MLPSLKEKKSNLNRILEGFGTLQKEMQDNKRYLGGLVQNLQLSVDLAVATRDEEKFNEFANLMGKTKMPFPFRTATECEKYLANDENLAVASTAFNVHEQVIQFKSGASSNNDSRFPARILVDFLFTPEARQSFRGKNFSRIIGEHTKAFWVDRARFMMGQSWNEDARTIIKKIRRNISFTNGYN